MTDHTERRRTIRIEVNGTLKVETASPGPALRLVDVGMGGFSVRTPSAIALNVVTMYRFSTPNEKWSAELSARAVHSKVLRPQGGPLEYLTGFAFVKSEAPETQRRLMEMMDHATDMSFS